MRKYNYKKAKKLIEENSDIAIEAYLGMKEDWHFTAESIWTKEEGYNKEYQLDNPDEKIAGINQSNWATPILRLYFEEDYFKDYICDIGILDFFE